MNLSGRKAWIEVVAAALLVVLLVAGGSLLVGVYKKHWRRVKTLDTFGILIVEADRCLSKHPADADPWSIRHGILAGYRERTGMGRPLDGWGNAIEVEVSVTGSSCNLRLKSAGYDKTMNTADDVTQEVEFSLGYKCDDLYHSQRSVHLE